jgi:hypothetical protein
MILNKLNRMEQEARLQSERALKRESAIKSLQSILNQIDFSVEEVPTDDSDWFLRLLKSLKDDDLSKEEEKLVDEILHS